jgi:23S rRNA pseudouridine2605 synthase
MTEKIRLQRYLASAGVAARRKAEELIVAGHVRVNGKQVRLLGTKVDPARDQVTVNGEAVHPRDNFYVLLNKPKGCITAIEDDRGRPTVMEFLPNLPIPVRPVGRLDYYAEGVVLLTNDGDLASRLVSSHRHIPKTYHVKVRGEIRRDHIEALRNGVRLEDGTSTLPAEINHLPGESRHSWLAVTVIENKQHQVQRMMEALGYQVQKLQCVAFANLTFHGLRVGDARELNQAELNALRDLVELDHSAAARGVWRTYREDTDIPRRAREKLRAEAAEAEIGPDAEAAMLDWRAEDEEPAPRDDRRAAGSARDDRRPSARPSSRPTAGGARAVRSARDDRRPSSRPAGRSGARDDRRPSPDRGARSDRGTAARSDRGAVARGPSSRGPAARSGPSGRGAARPGASRPGAADDRAPRRTSGGQRALTASLASRTEDRPRRGASDRPTRGASDRPSRGRPSSFGPRDGGDRPARSSASSFGPRSDRPTRGASSYGARASDRPSRGGAPSFAPGKPRRPDDAELTPRSAAPKRAPSRPTSERATPSTPPSRAGRGSPAPRPSPKPRRK